MRVIERRAAVRRTHDHAAQVGALLDRGQILHGVGVARVVVDDDEPGVLPIDGFIEQLDAFLQQVQAVAGGDDDRHRQLCEDAGFGAELVVAGLAKMSGLGQEWRSGAAAAPRGVGECLAGVLVGRVRERQFFRPRAAA